MAIEDAQLSAEDERVVEDLFHRMTCRVSQGYRLGWRSRRAERTGFPTLRCLDPHTGRVVLATAVTATMRAPALPDVAFIGLVSVLEIRWP